MKKKSQTIRTIRVGRRGQEYPVWIGRGLLGRAGAHVRRVHPNCSRLFVVSSPGIWRRWGNALTHGLEKNHIHSEVLFIPEGERSKRIKTVESLAEGLLGRGADRGSVLAAFGGGVVGDVAGFLAATYMRGIAYVQIPTTLVAQVDSAVGGKTGVNLASGKNLLGTFHRPLAVLVDPQTLATLAEREYRAGLYEVVKYAVLGDPQLFDYLERRLPAVLAREPGALMTIVTRSVRLKARIVTQDEREADLRRVLNLGHTFGHALETLAGYGKLRHGEAVGWGLLAATALARRTGRLTQHNAERIEKLVLSVGSLRGLPRLTPETIYKQMSADKKKKGRALHLVLPHRVGKVEITDRVGRRDILASLSELRRVAAAQ